MNFKNQQTTVKLDYMKIKFLGTFILTFLFQTNSYAYLDPGSGSILLQALIGGLAAAATTLTVYWSRFKNFILKLKNKKIKKEEKER